MLFPIVEIEQVGNRCAGAWCPQHGTEGLLGGSSVERPWSPGQLAGLQLLALLALLGKEESPGEPGQGRAEGCVRQVTASLLDVWVAGAIGSTEVRLAPALLQQGTGCTFQRSGVKECVPVLSASPRSSKRPNTAAGE